MSLRFAMSRRPELVRGLTSRAESNGSVGSLNRSLSVLSACSTSPLTHEARLAESPNAAEPMFAYQDREVPGGRGLWWLRGGKAEERRRRSRKVRIKHRSIGCARKRCPLGAQFSEIHNAKGISKKRPGEAGAKRAPVDLFRRHREGGR